MSAELRRCRAPALLAITAISCLCAPAPSLAAAEPSQATLVLGGRALPQPYQRWVDEMHAPAPAGRVRLRLVGYRRNWKARMIWREPALILLTTRGRKPSTLFHELGHVFDMRVLTDGARQRFARRVLGLPGRSRRSAELFADVYSKCAEYRRLRRSVITPYGLRLTPRRHRRGCRFIRALARRQTARVG